MTKTQKIRWIILTGLIIVWIILAKLTGKAEWANTQLTKDEAFMEIWVAKVSQDLDTMKAIKIAEDAKKKNDEMVAKYNQAKADYMSTGNRLGKTQ